MNSDLMNQFLEELGTYGLEIGNQLSQVEVDCDDYLYYADIVEQLQNSKVGFCVRYFSLSESDKSVFQKKLVLLFKDQEIVDNIIQEIINLYYLNECGLLELEEIADQKEVAFENLETLSTKIEKYLAEINYDQLMTQYEKLSAQVDGIVLLGSTLEEGCTPIQDINFLKIVLENMPLSIDEKKKILFELIQYNIAVYRQHVENMRENIPIDSSIELEELRDNPIISEECMMRINELLSQRDIIERIVNIINDEFTTVINIKAPTPEDEEQIDSSIAMAKEVMMESIQQNQTMSPEAALDEFFAKYDETARRKRELIVQLTEATPVCSLPIEEQESIFQTAFDFVDAHQMSIREMHTNDQIKIRQYMLSLFQTVANRKMMYESGIFESREVLEREAAYEIAIYKDLLDAVGADDVDTYGKICTKLQEILDCLGFLHRKSDSSEKGAGHLFFLMEEDELSSLESDVGMGSKGVSSVYYGELRNQLLSIEDRSHRKNGAVQPANDGYKLLRKYGVRYLNGTKVKTFYIPIGRKDAIIVGASFLHKKDVFKTQDNRIKRLQEQIELLKTRLSSPESYAEEVIKADITRERIMSQFGRKELDDMFSDSSSDSDSKGHKK